MASNQSRPNPRAAAGLPEASPKCKTEGLRVAGASVMPAITSANTQAPVVMIAEFA
jgi:hypothetical protein